MADTLDIAQSSGAKNVNTHDLKSVAKIVEIVFHTDRYEGRCKLYPVDGNRAANRLKNLKAEPEDWCRPEFMQCCSTHKIPCYFTTEIKQDPDRPNRWVCFVPDPYIPFGRYMLEAPRKKGKPIYQIVEIKGKAFATSPFGRALDNSASGVQLLIDSLFGDGVSLEESLYNLCSYRFESSIGTMREDDMTKVAGGKDPESGLKTALGIAQSAQESVANLVGVVKVDFPLYKNLKKFESFIAGDKGRFTKQIMGLWEKSGLEKSFLDYSKDVANPNIDGLLIAVKDDDGKYKRLSGLGIIDENYIKNYQIALEQKQVSAHYTLGDVFENVEMVGTCLSMLDNVLETCDMLAAFQKSWQTWVRMGAVLRRVSEALLKHSDERQPCNLHGGGCFIRGDLTMLENLKMVADNAASDAQDAGWAWFMKMAPQALGFCKFGELLSDFKAGKNIEKAYNAVAFVATWTDKLTNANVAKVYKDRITTKWHDMNAWMANENALMYHAMGMSVRFYAVQSIALQFYVRAKVLYGLKRLIDMCGPVSANKRRTSKYNFIQTFLEEKKTFDQAVDELEVKRYIDELCLAEAFWVRKDHLTVDWLHHWLREKDPNHGQEVILTKEPTKRKEDWFKVEFQRYWPIHYMDIEDVHKFARNFATDWSFLDDNDVESCLLEYGKSEWESVPDDSSGQLKSLKINSWEPLEDGTVIDSETPVRAILIFKASSGVRPGVPVTFQIERTDWLNVTGPAYNTVVRFLAPPPPGEDGKITRDPTLQKYKWRLGAVVNFTYSYEWKKDKNSPAEPAKVYHGLKPMIETAKWSEMLSPTGFGRLMWARNRRSKQEWWPSNQTFAVRYVIANGEVQGYAGPRGRIFDSTAEVTVLPGHVTGPEDADFEARNKAKFTDLEFLERQVADAPPPPAPVPEVEKVVLEYRTEESKWKPVVSLGISVNDPVRVVIVLKKKVLGIPAVVCIKRTDGMLRRNVRGPYYTDNVVRQLDDLGPDYKGKWGLVIQPWYYLMHWETCGSDIRVRVINDGHVWHGVKPITSDDVCSSDGTHPASPKTWDGYAFSVYYGIGSNNPADAKDVVSIPGSIMNDVPLSFPENKIGGSFPLTGYGIYGIGVKQQVSYDGATVSTCTMPFLSFVYKVTQFGNLEDAEEMKQLTANQFHSYLKAVESTGNLYDIVKVGTCAY